MDRAAGALGKLDCLVRVGDVIEATSACTMAVFHAAKYTNFAFDGHAALVRKVDDLASDFDVLFKAGRSLAVRLQ